MSLKTWFWANTDLQTLADPNIRGEISSLWRVMEIGPSSTCHTHTAHHLTLDAPLLVLLCLAKVRYITDALESLMVLDPHPDLAWIDRRFTAHRAPRGRWGPIVGGELRFVFPKDGCIVCAPASNEGKDEECDEPAHTPVLAGFAVLPTCADLTLPGKGIKDTFVTFWTTPAWVLYLE